MPPIPNAADQLESPNRRLVAAFTTDVRACGGTVASIAPAPAPVGSLDGFAGPVRRYFDFMQITGMPRVTSFVARFDGRFRLRPRSPWMTAQALQCNTSDPITRVFTMRLSLARVVWMIGHDTYHAGTGRMIGRLFDRATVVDGSGPELDIGELSTWLNDAVLLAPSMLLTPSARFTVIDEHSFDVTASDTGREVTARVTVDDHGAPVDYSTTDRWADLPAGRVRARWRTPIAGWDTTVRPPRPHPGSAMWDLPDGQYTYVTGRFTPLAVNIDDSDLARVFPAA